MTAGVRVTLDQGGIDQLLHTQESALAKYLLQKGNEVVNAAKSRANVDTGLMRSSISVRLGVDPYTGGPSAEVVAATHYAKYVHDGTSYMEGNPFLEDAVHDVFG